MNPAPPVTQIVCCFKSSLFMAAEEYSKSRATRIAAALLRSMVGSHKSSAPRRRLERGIFLMKPGALRFSQSSVLFLLLLLTFAVFPALAGVARFTPMGPMNGRLRTLVVDPHAPGSLLPAPHAAGRPPPGPQPPRDLPERRRGPSPGLVGRRPGPGSDPGDRRRSRESRDL